MNRQHDAGTGRSVRRWFPAGSTAVGRDPVSIGPADTGWTYCGLRVVTLDAGTPRSLETGTSEMIVLPLSAQQVSVTVSRDGVDPVEFELDGRVSVFTRVSDFAYVGRDSSVTLWCPDGGEIAMPAARCERSLPPSYGDAHDVSVEIRGAGPATRQVNNFASPETWSNADRLMCVELLTPDGNWSSYPPHRHDDSPECPVNNEELYYFRIGRIGSDQYDPSGFGIHRTYTDDGAVDDTIVVRDGDVYAVPRGYHGPCIATPGHPMYYLNVLAGPSGERSMAFCDDPAHHWVRDEWTRMAPDPRCPMTTDSGCMPRGPGHG